MLIILVKMADSHVMEPSKCTLTSGRWYHPGKCYLYCVALAEAVLVCMQILSHANFTVCQSCVL
jgi:hypothetical protein